MNRSKVREEKPAAQAVFVSGSFEESSAVSKVPFLKWLLASSSICFISASNFNSNVEYLLSLSAVLLAGTAQVVGG